MALYIITYDLYSPGQNYSDLIRKIQYYPSHVHLQRSVWVIETTQSAEQVKVSLQSSLDQNDRLFVGELSGDSAVLYPTAYGRKTMLTGL